MHVSNSNVYMVVVRGTMTIALDDEPAYLHQAGEILAIPSVFNLAAFNGGSFLHQVEGTTNIYLSLHMNNQRMNITTDHQRLQALGLTNASLSAQIYQAMEGVVTTTMNVGEVTGWNVSVGVQRAETPSMEDLLATQVFTPLGLQVPLREVADIEMSNRANLITGENLEYTVNVLGYTHSRAFSHIVRDINGIIASHPMPEGYRAGMTGEQEALTEAMGDMIFLMALAIVFVYLLLVPQFKSFLHPITIMAVIPLVMIGVALALGLTNKSTPFSYWTIPWPGERRESWRKKQWNRRCSPVSDLL